MTLSRESIIAGLVAQGAPRAAAEAAAEREIAREQLSPSRFASEQIVPRPQRSGSPTTPIVPHPGQFVRPEAPIVPPAIEWPVRLLLPWSLLVSDNERKEPYVVQTAEGPRARMRLTARYAEAKEKIAQLATRKLDGAAAAAIPLELWAKVWVPGGSSRNDVSNFGKGVHDALEGILYTNDRLLHWTHWCRVGTDVDAPRAELLIAPVPQRDPI